ncbi:MAG TPA: hypothetical protein VF376_13250, partial [Thermoanaerobaculia bacterium]
MSALFGLLFALASGAPEDTAFEKWFVERGVDVEIARSASIPWVRGTGELPVRAGDVESILLDFGRYRELMEPAVSKVEVLESGE